MPFRIYPDWTSDNVTEVAIIGRLTNLRKVVTVWHFKREEEDPAESARDILNNWQDHILDRTPNNYTVEGARYRDRNVVNGVVGFIAPDPGKDLVGGLSGETMTPNVSRLVHKDIETTVGERAGRFYWYGVLEANANEDGLYGDTSLGLDQAALDAFFNGLDGSEITEGSIQVVHAPRQEVDSEGEPVGPPESTEATVDKITGLRMDPVVATQRRRLRK